MNSVEDIYTRIDEMVKKGYQWEQLPVEWKRSGQDINEKYAGKVLPAVAVPNPSPLLGEWPYADAICIEDGKIIDFAIAIEKSIDMGSVAEKLEKKGHRVIISYTIDANNKADYIFMPRDRRYNTIRINSQDEEKRTTLGEVLEEYVS